MTDTIESLRADRDALHAHNETLKADLARARAGAGKYDVFGGSHGGGGRVSRDVLDGMSPGARFAFLRGGGTVVE